MRLLILLIVLYFHVSSAAAELYRWVDERGNVHFSDKKPLDNEAQEISDQVKQHNIDYSGDVTARQLERYQRQEAAKQTEQQQLRRRGSHDADEARQKNCRQAKQRLRLIRGPVVFYDQKGNPQQVSEQERERRALALEKQINQYCQ